MLFCLSKDKGAVLSIYKIKAADVLCIRRFFNSLYCLSLEVSLVFHVLGLADGTGYLPRLLDVDVGLDAHH